MEAIKEYYEKVFTQRTPPSWLSYELKQELYDNYPEFEKLTDSQLKTIANSSQFHFWKLARARYEFKEELIAALHIKQFVNWLNKKSTK